MFKSYLKLLRKYKESTIQAMSKGVEKFLVTAFLHNNLAPETKLVLENQNVVEILDEPDISLRLREFMRELPSAAERVSAPRGKGRGHTSKQLASTVNIFPGLSARATKDT